ncbi:glutamyl-tRNA reductase-binding protein, chloroplastic isoform X1 [Gossypium australe]|uniref:Glutamyl-tRNA reductase-binding protein, chloroplastic isoform X1 n=1 Tax=Gossypium australe TaxID=47621 RepID=A0A5B6X8A7_9ROSI|nr:glutamyl-tRNA reductase-binding protein, chloroplastic isoform X1 [Gossypium australe]
MNLQIQTQSLSTHFPLPPFPPKPKFLQAKPKRSFKLCSSLSTVSVPPTKTSLKPFPAEVSRTIMELSSIGTLSTLAQDGWPLGVGVRFAVDAEGTPVLCLPQPSPDNRSTLHVQLDQCGLRTPQCTIQGSLTKPADATILRRFDSVWKKRFGESADIDNLYTVDVQRVLQMEDLNEDGVWVTSSDYKNANPDPLRNSAEEIVNEINTNNREDVHRFCNVYVDLDFQRLSTDLLSDNEDQADMPCFKMMLAVVKLLNTSCELIIVWTMMETLVSCLQISSVFDAISLVSEAKMIWVDRLGFDLRIYSPQKGVFDVRIPFPREVTDEKGAKSSFNGMSQLAWEVEKNFHAPDFEKVKELKKIVYSGGR